MTVDPSRPLAGQLEPAAEATYAVRPSLSAADLAQLSIAISLKRIADAMDGTTMGICISETTIGRRHDR